jgi:demethylmenaquinone methyltransferase/2-methoxy-6-polyprenyl-1,4-benzoquinol methylase
VESKFYRADEHRAEKVHELFATIARRYDLLNDIMSAGLHRRWKQRLVELAGGKAKAGSGEREQVLDLCCGTGDIAWLFARRGASVIGADFTEEMLRVAAARKRRGSARSAFAEASPFAQASADKSAGRAPSSNPGPCWVRADALRLPFGEDSFDVVSVGYGLRNLADIEEGLREILRVLRPGGRFLSLDFGKPESPAFRALYFGYLRTALPILGRMFCGDPDTHGYILASLQDYPAQRGIKELMEACGYGDCGFEEFCRGSMAINFGSKPQ